MRAVIVCFALLAAACGFDGTGGPVDDDEPIGDDEPVPPTPRYASCQAALAAGQTTSAVYRIAPAAGDVFEAYCDMTTAGGGWTLAIKADGERSTFDYDSEEWLTDVALNPGSPDRDGTEAKLATYARLPAHQVLVQSGGGNVVLNLPQTVPLLDVIGPGDSISLAMSEDAWAPIAPNLLAPNLLGWATCSQEDGINRDRSGYKARIGLVARGYEEGLYGSCGEDAQAAVGVGLAAGDSCEVIGGASVGHVYAGCAVTAPFVYVYVR